MLPEFIPAGYLPYPLQRRYTFSKGALPILHQGTEPHSLGCFRASSFLRFVPV